MTLVHVNEANDFLEKRYWKKLSHPVSDLPSHSKASGRRVPQTPRPHGEVASRRAECPIGIARGRPGRAETWRVLVCNCEPSKLMPGVKISRHGPLSDKDLAAIM